MAKIVDQNRRLALKVKMGGKLSLYEKERRNRSFYYDLRKKYYAGEIQPEVGEGHERINSQMAAAIADRMSAYAGTNCPDINFRSKDITNDPDNMGAQIMESAIREVLNACDFPQVFADANYTASWSGDGFIVTETRKGIPYHYEISRPGNVMVGWKTDNYKEIEWWAFIYGLTPEQAKSIFDEDFQPMMNELEQDNVVEGERTGKRLFGLPFTSKTAHMEDKGGKYVKITDFHTFIDIDDEVKAGDNIICVNDMPVELNKGQAKQLRHFLANKFPQSPTGISDFEHCAHMITMYDKKLSEEADAVSQGVYHKLVTNDRNVAKLQERFKPGKTQIITLADENSKLDVLQLNSQAYNSEPLIKNLLNIIRSTSFLQELGQDQVAPNISGRALTMIYQGVIQSVQKKRVRWTMILKDMVVSDIEILAKEDAALKNVAFDENGMFRYDIEVVWPEVLEQDKQTTVTLVQAMRQGQTPLISDITARQMVGIADPVAEGKRVEQELDMKVKAQLAQANQIKSGMSTGPQKPILSESQNQPEQGVPSGQGMAGSAQDQITPEGAAAQQLNNGGA